MREIPEWIRESNLIEGVDSYEQDVICTNAFSQFIDFNKLHGGISETAILILHGYIMKTLRPDIAGRYRKCGVTVGGIICPSWRGVPVRIKNWIRKHGSANMEESIKKAHIEFEKIHPFVDGNGRTGRIIMNWQRVFCGLPELCIKSSERWDYYEWFK